MFKYLYEKDYKSGMVDRRLYNSVDELLDYMNKDKECLFNAGFKDAEIRLYRLKLEERN